MSIIGHSMGGHGALCTYLASKAKQYRSASAFAPISNPINAPWGKKAFEGYLQGGVQEAKEQYDATELISKHSDPVHILIDYVRHNLPLISLKIDIKNTKTQGTNDTFYKAGQLLPENFLNAARAAGYNEEQVRVREQVGYDHSYYFVSSPCVL